MWWLGLGGGAFPGVPVAKNPPANAGNAGLIPGSGRPPGEGNGYPRQYSCLENSMDREAWWVTVHEVAKSGTWLSVGARMLKKKWKKGKGRKQTGRKKEKDRERKKGERERGRTGRKKENGQFRPISLGTYISNKNLHRRKNIHNAWYYGLAFHVQRKLRSSVNPSLAKRKITLKLIHVTWTQVERPGSYPNFTHLAN